MKGRVAGAHCGAPIPASNGHGRGLRIPGRRPEKAALGEESMNIKQAKEQIRQAVEAYREKNEFGDLEIPVERQRPIFLMGPPGIGKTAIMEQIAQELGIGLVSYSMTHHTRQSALGLPFIVHKTYRGEEYDVAVYTMSEIIASVHDCIERNGFEEGILFLDEINCVSETLAPSMLQFLQYKTFGRHRVPDGWIVVTAGNPPEYNNSVREFDIVTWDRLKRIDVEPDFAAWKEYAVSRNVHPAILTYLEIRQGDFYQVETTVDGKRFVTARGWVDMSDMIRLYERRDYAVNEQLVRQYLQSPEVARRFAAYYDLFRKYRGDYQVDAILSGNETESVRERAAAAKFDERLSLLGLLLDRLNNGFAEIASLEEMLTLLMDVLRPMKPKLTSATADGAAKLLANCEDTLSKRAEAGKRASSMSEDAFRAHCRAMKLLEEMAAEVRKTETKEPFSMVKVIFDRENNRLTELAKCTREQLERAFAFCENVFSGGQELLILVTELTIRPAAARFISHYGCDGYFRNNRELLFYERRNDIIRQIHQMRLDD